MKKLFFLLVLALMSLGATAQTVTLMFTGKDARNQYVKLNRVVITNLTQNWQETIYYPDTILMMGGTGIDDFENAKEFKVSQNVPNPFDGATDFELQMIEKGNVAMEITDMNGRSIVGANNYSPLPAGTHHFRATVATAGTYLLTARCGNNAATIKMVNNGGAGENAITYLGEGKFYPLTATLKGGKGSTNKPFAFGDNMIYMGYAMINGKECVSQNVEKRQLISETITLSFDNYPPTVTTAPVTEITSHSAMSGGEVLQDGGSAVITKGVCWNTKPNPTVNDSHIAAGSGLGSFVSALTGLTYGTTYYVRAYATNSVGTSYGEEKSFTTLIEPTVTTNTVSNIRNTTATCGGNVTADGGAEVTARGVCWNTYPNPTINNSKTTDGTGTGNFTSNMTGLTPATTYYVRAYATNSVGTSYGEERSFTTLIEPTVTTNAVSNVKNTTATCGGNVTSDGGTTVTARGVCWSTSPNPTISDNKTTDGTGTGNFTSSMTGLTPGTTYYVRAYATNSVGTSYGEERSFTTTIPDGSPCPGAATITDRDNNTYNTVKIGNQCWMKENLKTTKYADGTSISQGSTTSDDVAYWYYPNNNSSNKATYGLLYNWKAVMRNSSSSSANPSGVQGICPTGWHVPSGAEWTQLTDYVSSQSQYQCNSGSTNIAKALASTTGWNSSTVTCAVGNTPSNNNATGFGALPAGYYNGSYGYFGNVASYWSATEYDIYYAYSRYLHYNDAAVLGRKYNNRYTGFSVRCLRDN